MRTFVPLLSFMYPSLTCFVSLLTLFLQIDFQNVLLKKKFYVGLLEAISLFAILLVEVRSSTSGSLHTLQKWELVGSCCCTLVSSLSR